MANFLSGLGGIGNFLGNIDYNQLGLGAQLLGAGQGGTYGSAPPNQFLRAGQALGQFAQAQRAAQLDELRKKELEERLRITQEARDKERRTATMASQLLYPGMDVQQTPTGRTVNFAQSRPDALAATEERAKQAALGGPRVGAVAPGRDSVDARLAAARGQLPPGMTAQTRNLLGAMEPSDAIGSMYEKATEAPRKAYTDAGEIGQDLKDGLIDQTTADAAMARLGSGDDADKDFQIRNRLIAKFATDPNSLTPAERLQLNYYINQPSKDPITGQNIVNNRLAFPQSGPGSRQAPPPPAAPPAQGPVPPTASPAGDPVLPPPSAPKTVWGMSRYLSGPVRKLAPGVGRATGILGGDIGTTSAEYQSIVKTRQNDFITAMSTNPDGRVAVYEQQRLLKDVGLDPKLIDNQASFEARARGVNASLNEMLANHRDIAGDTSINVRDRAESRRKIKLLEDYMRFLGVPPEGEGGSGQGGGKTPAQIEADKILSGSL